MWAAQTFVNIAQLTIMKLGIPWPPHSPTAELSLPLEVVTISSAWRVQPYWGQASSRKQYRCDGLSNILKLQATFLYSIYHPRAGKTNLFHMRGGRFHAANTSCTFKSKFIIMSVSSSNHNCQPMYICTFGETNL